MNKNEQNFNLKTYNKKKISLSSIFIMYIDIIPIIPIIIITIFKFYINIHFLQI